MASGGEKSDNVVSESIKEKNKGQKGNKVGADTT